MNTSVCVCLPPNEAQPNLKSIMQYIRAIFKNKQKNRINFQFIVPTMIWFSGMFWFFVLQANSKTTKNNRNVSSDISYLSPFSRDSKLLRDGDPVRHMTT